MRKLVMFIVGLAAFALIPPEVAAATKLTSQQVANVCGSALKTETTSVSGCRKACGLNKEHSCQFGCYKGVAGAIATLAGKAVLHFSPSCTPIALLGAH
jgi:hypothetical protein